MLVRTGVVVLAAILVVSVPSPAATHVGAPGGPRSAPAAFSAYVAPIPRGSVLRPLGPSTRLFLAFTLAFSNGSRLASDLASVADPSSSRYRQFLSYAAFLREFGPPPSSIARVEEALRAAGASSVSVSPGGLAVDAVLPAASAGKLLSVRFVAVAAPGGATGYTAVGTPELPSGLAGSVVGVDGLSDLGDARALASTTDAVAGPAPVPGGLGKFVQDGSTGEDWFIGSDYTQAYGATELLPGSESVHGATYPSGVAIATLLASGFNETTFTSLPPWNATVIDDYYNETFPAGWPLPSLTGVPVPLPGAGAPAPPGSFHGLGDSLGFEVENSLDLEMAGSLAPGAALYNFYFNGSLLENPGTSGTLGTVSTYFASDLGAALEQDYGPAHLAVISCSFGLPDLNNSQWDSELVVAARMGVTVVSASGDQGDAPEGAQDRNPSAYPLWPATAAFNTSGVISVGGVSVHLSGDPTAVYTSPPIDATYDSSIEGIAGASAWWDTSRGFGDYAGTEGGTSLTYAEPYWQVHSAAQGAIVNATEREGFDQLGRAGPDVGFPANTTVTFVSLGTGGSPNFVVLGGTSVAAPVFAGLLADVVAVENATLPHGRTGLGFLDPELYRIASYYRAQPGPADPFLDVVLGHNYLFSASAGWDPLTGWGGISAPLLLAADEDPSVADYTYTGPIPTLPSPHPPATSPLTIVAVFSGAAAVILLATYLLVSSRRVRRVPTYRLPSGYPPTPPAWSSLPPPAIAYATFSCPSCGAERPSEPGHCPTCGAM